MFHSFKTSKQYQQQQEQLTSMSSAHQKNNNSEIKKETPTNKHKKSKYGHAVHSK